MSTEAEYMTGDEAARFVSSAVRAYLGANADVPADDTKDGWKGMCAFGVYSSHPDRLSRQDVAAVAHCIVKCCESYRVNGWGALEMPHGLIRAEQVGSVRFSQHYDVMIDETVTRFDMGTCKDGARVWAGGPMLQVVRG